ncbi:MAG: penicillin-binding protein 2 [Candidatus Firestonebacteria bacterium]
MVFERLRDKEEEKRFKFLVIFSIILFLILVIRVIILQVIDGEKYKKIAQSNSTRVVPERACRGIIYDRYKEKVVDNMPSFTVSIIPADLKNKEKVIERLTEVLDITEEEICEKLERQKYKVFEAIKIKGNLNSQDVSIIEEHKTDLPGVIIHTEPKRNYINNEMASHVLGYVGEVSLDEANGGKYYFGDLTGKIGLEKKYDSYLSGLNGATQIMVNSIGKEIKVVGKKEPAKGVDLTLTLDLRLQKICEDLIKGKKGVIVAMDPRSGEIYSMVSKPSFNPNMFSNPLEKANWDNLVSSSESPFLNRTITGLYSPGSTFKVILASAVLEEHLLDVKDLFLCHGTYWYSTWNYNCWKKEGHGSLNIIDAITYSCDIFFYQTGLLVKVDKIAEYSKLFGLGAETGIDLDGEKKGLVPSKEWKEKMFHEHWMPGNTIQLSIGQGFLLTTPIQMLNVYNIIINNGVSYKPHLVKFIGDKEVVPEISRVVSIREDTLKIVKKGLWESVNKSGGTGWRAKSNFSLAGKTATIENPHGASHSSFIGFAPFSNPEISVIVFLEGGGSGGEIAAPITKNIIESYYKLKKERYARK